MLQAALQDDATATEITPDLIAVTTAHNRRMFTLAILSTAAVSISALFTLWTRWKRLKHDLAKKKRR